MTAGTLYKGYFRNGKRSGEGTLNFLFKRKIQKGVWLDGVCVTSIFQDDVEKEDSVPVDKWIAEVRWSAFHNSDVFHYEISFLQIALVNPVGVKN